MEWMNYEKIVLNVTLGGVYVKVIFLITFREVRISMKIEGRKVKMRNIVMLYFITLSIYSFLSLH